MPVGQRDLFLRESQSPLFGAVGGNVGSDVGQDQQKLLTTITAGQVGATSALSNQATEPLQYLVAGLVSMRVVELFEVVNVDHDQR